jgi:hypothetical protein
MTTDTYNLIISGNIHEAGMTIVMIVKTDVGYGPTIQFSDDNVGVLRILCAYLVLGVHFAYHDSNLESNLEPGPRCL